MPKDQDSLKIKLYEYLKQRGIDEESDAYLKNLIEQGYCFGISVCRGAMRITGKLAWWQDATTHISTWDDMPASLEQTIHLQDENDVNGTKLKTVFENLIHFIVFQHATPESFPFYEQRDQSTFLLPGGPFELLDSNNHLITIKNNHRIAGHFSKEDLIRSLSGDKIKKVLESNICLVHSQGSEIGHTCELAYSSTTKKWSFFDPNYESGEAKEFTTLDELVDEMILIQGHDIAFDLACVHPLEETPFLDFDELIKNSPEKLIEGNGFRTMLGFLPNKIPQLLENLERKGVLSSLNLARPEDEDGNTLLTILVFGNNLEMVKLFLDYHADPNVMNKFGATPLMIAAQYGLTDMVIELLNHKANPDLVISPYLSVLFDFAKEKNREEEVQDFFKLHHGETDPKFTALHLAVFFGNTDIVSTLLPQTSPVDLDYMIEMAQALDHGDIVSILQSKKQEMDKIKKPEVGSIHTFFGQQPNAVTPQTEEEENQVSEKKPM